MQAVSPERAAVQAMDTDDGRVCVAMAEKFLDRVDIVAPSSGCVTDKWPLWVITGRDADSPPTTASSQDLKSHQTVPAPSSCRGIAAPPATGSGRCREALIPANVR